MELKGGFAMKKILAVFLSLIVAVIPLIVIAEDFTPDTRQEVIRLEGTDETIITTHIRSDLGYSMWIDTNYLAPQSREEGSDLDLYVSPYATEGFRCELAIRKTSL
jgi:hypothetical protein